MMWGETASYKSWALQAEESYQLQLALALRLSSEAKCADDPNFLAFGTDERSKRSFTASAEAVSHRFWVNGCLSYNDKIPDGFYLIHGMDPYVWTISTDYRETGRIPSFESLKAVDPSEDLQIEVVLIDKSKDLDFRELQNRVLGLSRSWVSGKEVVDQLAEIVCNCMGGVASTGEDCFSNSWKKCTEVLKDRLGSVVIPIGNLNFGFCVHRALLFKVLADIVNLPCRIARGCKYCGQDYAASCLVQFGGREYLVDLIKMPGSLLQPDSFLNGTSSILVSSPLCHPRFKTAEAAEEIRTLAELYFRDCQSLDIAFDDATAVAGAATDQIDNSGLRHSQSHETSHTSRNNSSCDKNESVVLLLPPRNPRPDAHDYQKRQAGIFSSNVNRSTHLGKGSWPSQILPITGDAQAVSSYLNPRPDTTRTSSMQANPSAISKSSHELFLYEEDLEIRWSDLRLKEKIGEGSFGTVCLAEWRGGDVAVKILNEQDFHAERSEEFLREVAIMKRLRHPNIVLFMGAVTQRPNLSIVTEYLPRGSLHKLLKMPDAEKVLDFKLRLHMAYDVAKGMNYLHQYKPPIVHRDLKSPNLLVDSKYTVKICDFGLSRSKANTYLSSQTAAGTPQWMAPEVLRYEPSNEKSDVYSFGVILWELVTLQQPWKNLDPCQVVGIVGFKGETLEIPSKVDPQVASLIEACWAFEPMKRPSFSSIMDWLQHLILYSTDQPVDGHILQIT